MSETEGFDIDECVRQGRKRMVLRTFKAQGSPHDGAEASSDLQRLLRLKAWIEQNAPKDVRDEFHAVYGAVREMLEAKR